MNDPLYYQYYDALFTDKPYGEEVETILKVFGNVPPRRILDVGCGTGGHAFAFAEKGSEVVGTDIDPEIIAIAERKRQTFGGPGKVTFLPEDVSHIDAGRFDLAVALFHVVNYIGRQQELLTFFKGIYDRLEEGGMFIFDCWNGAAATMDPPRRKESEITVGGERIAYASEPEIDLMAGKVTMKNHVAVTGEGGPPRTFSFEYDSYLWTPWSLTDLLKEAGFVVKQISAEMRPEVPADITTWKIMIVARKGVA